MWPSSLQALKTPFTVMSMSAMSAVPKVKLPSDERQRLYAPWDATKQKCQLGAGGGSSAKKVGELQ